MNCSETLEELGIGCIAFSPLAQGMLTDKYLQGVPADARAARGGSFGERLLSEENLAAGACAERDRTAARTDPGADGHRLGVAGPAGDLGADRRAHGGAARQFPGCAQQA